MTGINHAHNSRESRDECDAGNCVKSTIVKTWPDTKTSEPIATTAGAELVVRTLNNINVTQIIGQGVYIAIEEENIDDFIAALMWAKWYLEKGKYNEQTA